MQSLLAWLIPLLSVLVGFGGLCLFIRRDRREARKESNSRLEKIEKSIQEVRDKVFYVAGRVEEQRSQEYEKMLAGLSRRTHPSE